MPRALRVALLAVVVTAVLVAVGLGLGGSGGDEPSDAGSTPASPTTAPAVPLAEVDTRTVAVARAEFCDAVAADGVEDALGGPPTGTTSYADGQAAQVSGQVEDIAHEFGCGWMTGPAIARAWVFAPPVTRRLAVDLVEAARAEEDCTPQRQAPDFGAPSVALVCTTRRGVQASFRGLFGDAWLTCTVAGRFSPAEATRRADRWCSAVLDAART